jgi:hypothetical protein
VTESVVPIPSPDPIALPGPEPLLHGLLVLAFLLHALFMNLVLGGTPIMLVTDWLGHRTKHERYVRLGTTLAGVIPTAMALAVVLGVAPLLFLQALYGQFSYTAAILIGNVWIALIAVLIVAYYGLYLYKYGRGWLGHRPGLHLAIGGTSALLFLGVTLVFVTVSVLMLTPERWREIQATGFTQAIRLPSVLPRYFHMVLAALAGGGIFLVLYGTLLSSRWGRRLSSVTWQGYDAWIVRYGCAWTLAGTLPQIVVGPWLLLSLPDRVRHILMDGGSNTSLVFFTSLAFALLALVLLNAGLMVPRAKVLALGGAGSLIVTIALMAMVRDRVRYHWLAGHFDPATLPVTPQWGFIGLFALLLAGGAAVLIYLVRVSIRSRSSHSVHPAGITDLP